MAKADSDAYDWGPPRELGEGLLIRLSLNSEMLLRAIRHIVKAQGAAKRTRDETIASLGAKAKAAKTDAASEAFVEDLGWEVEESFYEEAARSMALVGMLAPFVETMFDRVFRHWGEKYAEDAWQLPHHDRWSKDPQRQWDCHYCGGLTDDERNVVKGITELIEASGLNRFLQEPLGTPLEALFQYRNKMFHNGLEWPTDQLAKFSKNVNANKWPADWFSNTSSNGEPSFFYVNDAFVNFWLKAIAAIVEALGKYGTFVRDRP